MGFPGGLDGKASACNVETRVWSLGQEDPLEKEMATHSRTLTWKIPWMEETGGLEFMGLKRARRDWTTSLHSPDHSHNIHFKITRLVLVKEKHVLEQDTLFYWLRQSSVDKTFVLFSSLRAWDPFLLLKGPGPLPPQGPRTLYQPTEELTLSLLSQFWTSPLVHVQL